MRSTVVLFALAMILSCVLPSANAQTCTTDQRTTLNNCIEQAEATCLAAVPECQKQPISLVDLRAAIAEKCNCEKAKNYGQYRSCVAHLMDTLRTFSLVDRPTRTAINSDNAVCKAAIKNRTRRHGKK